MGSLHAGRGSLPRGFVAVALLTLLAGPAPSAPELLEPAAGRFLVARRQIEGSMFARSIVLLIDASDRGASGLIVNRPTQIRLRELMKVPREREDLVHLGGPLAPGGMLFLTRAPDPPAGSRPIRGRLHLGESADGLRALIASGEPAERVRTFLGHAGWAPGQLDHEIARGDWFVIEGEVALAFEARGDESWEAALAPLEGIRVRAPGSDRVALR